MLDLLLVHQSSGSWEKALSNYSLPLSLISAVREVPEEYNIKLIDVRIVGKKALDQYLIQDGLLVGFSVLTGPSIKNALEIIHYIRAANPSIKILLGGIHPTILPEQTLSSPKIDEVPLLFKYYLKDSRSRLKTGKEILGHLLLILKQMPKNGR